MTVLEDCRLFNVKMQAPFQLEESEQKISKLEECDCHKSCRLDGEVKRDGSTWAREYTCQVCSCLVSKMLSGTPLTTKFAEVKSFQGYKYSIPFFSICSKGM